MCKLVIMILVLLTLLCNYLMIVFYKCLWVIFSLIYHNFLWSMLPSTISCNVFKTQLRSSLIVEDIFREKIRSCDSFATQSKETRLSPSARERFGASTKLIIYLVFSKLSLIGDDRVVQRFIENIRNSKDDHEVLPFRN